LDMKMQFKVLIPAAMVCFATVFAQAQTETQPAARPATDVAAPPQVERKAKMAKDLDLNEMQKAHFDKVNAEFRQQEKTAREQMAKERKQRNEARTKALKSTLTAEQSTKFDTLIAERKEQHKAARKEGRCRKGKQ
jgi:hypothetical protein